MESKGYELKHYFARTLGNDVLEAEKVKIASKFELGIFDPRFKQEWARFKQQNEERLLTMAFAECRFKKKRVKQ